MVRVSCLVACDRCPTAWCPLFVAWTHGEPQATDGVTPPLDRRHWTDPMPFLRCDGCGRLTGRLTGDFHLTV